MKQLGQEVESGGNRGWGQEVESSGNRGWGQEVECSDCIHIANLVRTSHTKQELHIDRVSSVHVPVWTPPPYTYFGTHTAASLIPRSVHLCRNHLV